MTEPAYPRRPPFFALRFIRLMVKTCAGAGIGPDGCWLLATIASTEDAKRYSGPVAFFNGNLADQLGVSISAFQRTRKKCVDAGWLHHVEGAKGKAATYWVQIPVTEEAKTDGPSDESDDHFPVQADQSSDQASEQDKRFPGQPDQATAFQPGGNRIPSEQHSSYAFPSSFPQEGANRSGSPAPAPKSTKAKPGTPRKPSGPQQEAFEVFGTAWQSKYGAKYAFTGGKDGPAVKWMLDQLGGDVSRFRAVVQRFLADDEKFYRDGRHQLGMLRAQFNRFQAEPPADARHAGYDLLPGQTYTPPTAEPMFPHGAAAAQREKGRR